MTAASAVARGRTAAEALMVDACTVTRITGRATDTTTGEVTDVIAALYAGKCRVQQSRGEARREDVAEDRVALLRIEVQLPMSVTGIQVGDVVTVTASALDSDLPGRVFRVQDLAHKTHATARRLGVVEVTDS